MVKFYNLIRSRNKFLRIHKNILHLRRKNAKSNGIMTILLVGLLLLSTAIAMQGAQAASPPTVLLGTAANFSVLAGSGITNTGPTTIYGDVGTYPTPSETGFGSVTIIGTNHGADAVTQQAKTDLLTAYNDAAGRTPATTIATELGGQTLIPGVYNSASGTFGITGTVTLDGQGDPNAVFIFQMQSTLVTASSSVVFLTNGTHSCNVFWQVGSSATIGTSSQFVGTILALTSITLTTSATVDGRALALNGAVTMDSNTIGQTVHIEGITLTPTSATNPVGTNHTITATVAGTGDPVPNRAVNFTIVSGPNAGLTVTAITDINGHATFTYQGNSPGTDTIQASFLNSQNVTITSTPVTKTWTPAPGPAVIVSKQISTDNTTWADADLPPGVVVTVGSNLYYRFNITNIGNVPLGNITLADNTYDVSGAVIPATLAPGESFVYYIGPITALLGQHTNIATATAQYNNANYTDTNNANYNGIPDVIPSISVVKQISGDNATWVDANVPPGISVVVGANVYYRFNVTNTGNAPLSNITLTDNTYDLSGAVIPVTLAPGESFVYYYGPVTALLGQHTNLATATGQYNNVTYNDTDNANYNAVPVTIVSINVEKQISSDNINWIDADVPPGLTVTVGSNVYYRFNVTNTGTVTLTNVTLTDNTYALSPILITSLAPGASVFYYFGPITAQLGQHTNIATATGQYNNIPFNSTDNANYNGTQKPKPCPSINVTKYVSSDNITWYDANSPPGLNITIGQNVYFKFEINNTGNVNLTSITLKDSCYKLTNLNLPSTLAPNATYTYYLGPIQAQKGQHTDTATATGKYDCKVYSDKDNANYCGVESAKPCIQIIKYVSADGCKWTDANCPPGLTVLAGSCVYFKFEVKNTGNVALTNINITDDIPFINAGIPNCLKPGESFKVTIGPIKACLLLNMDNATACGAYDNITVCDSDIAYYYGSPVTYTACDYTSKEGSNFLNCNFKTAFKNGMEIGNYTNSGYGYKWTSDKVCNLILFLKTTGTSGQITSDKLNPSDVKCGGGSLAVQTATLTLNVAFGNLGVKDMPCGCGTLHYIKIGDSLNGKTVTEILAISNAVLSGGQLPQGYTYNSLNTLITNLNCAYQYGQPTSWAITYLKAS